MTDLIHLDPQPLEVRDLEKREIVGRVIPYGEQISIRGRPESFTLGAVADIKVSQVKLFDHHERAVGKAIALEERQDGAYASFYVSKTARGNDLLEMASDGVLSFSPGFIPGTQTREGVHTRIKSMPEVSLVSMPAYTGAEVLSVREKEVPVEPEVEVVETRDAAAFDLAPLETRMDNFSAQLEKLQSSVDAPPIQSRSVALSPLRWFQAQVQANFNKNFEFQERLDEEWGKLQTRMASGEVAIPESLQIRALDDVTGTYPGAVPIVDASGLVVEDYIASQLVNVLDTRRPLFGSFGSFPMPRSGYAQIPVVTQHTEVAKRATQKTAIATRPLIVVKKSFEAEWFTGGVDIALELIRSAELPVLSMIWDDLLGQYAIMTEAGVNALFAADVVLAAAHEFTYTTAQLATASYAAFALAVATQAIVVRTATGAPATKLAVTAAQWPILVAMVDANDRRQFAVTGATNADAQVALNAESFTLPGGIDVFYAPGLVNAVLYNEQAFRAADGGPERVEALNVELMGHDLGVLGRVMLVPRIPAGVVVFAATPA